jgi:cytochrome c553
MKRSLLALLCTLTAFSVEAADAAKAAPKGDAARGQPIASAVCGACHGADGNSQLAVNPKLAGQHPEYLFKQMKNFKPADGKQPERVSAIMNGMIAAFDEGQMRDMAAYFAAQTQKGETAKNRETIELGQKLYRGGDQSQGAARLRRLPRPGRRRHSGAVPAHRRPVRRIHRSAIEGLPGWRPRQRPEQDDAHGRDQDDRRRNQGGIRLHRRLALDLINEKNGPALPGRFFARATRFH